MTFSEVIEAAQKELDAEKFKKAVEAEKKRIKSKKSNWISKLFPFKITIKRI